MLYTQFTNSVTFRDIVLALGLIVFLFIKIPTLPVPFFWDESWVYGPAVSEMGRILPSLLPGSIDINLSRGHPMLFHFLGGIWGNVFGISVTSLHVFALTISLSFLAIFYKVARKQAPKFAFLTTILLAYQGVFMAQSAMVLPEMLVTLLVFLSLYTFSNNKHNIAIFYAALCLLTKESGAILLPTLGLSFLFHSLLTDTFSWKKSILFLGKLLLALAPYLIFLLIQKERFGWYFFPNHLDLQIETSRRFQQQFITALKFIFFSQGRILITAAAVTSYLIHFRKNRLALTLLGIVFLHLIILFTFPFMRWIVLLSYMLISLLALAPFGKEIKMQYRPHYNSYFTIIIFTFLYLLFSAKNFLSSRYLLCILPFTVLISAIAIDKLKKPIISYLIYAVLILVCFTQAMRTTPISDVNQSFVNVGQAQKELFEYLEEQQLYDSTFMATFLVHESLKKRYAGHRSTERPFTSVVYSPNSKEAFFSIISSFEGDYTNSSNKANRTKEVIRSFSSGDIVFTLEKYSAVQNAVVDDQD